MSDPFAGPATAADSATDVDEEHVPKPSIWMYLAVASSLISGLLGLTYALQMMVFIRFYDFGWVGPWVFGAVALAVLILGAAILRARTALAYALAAATVFNLLLAVAWHVYAAIYTLFSPLGILWLLAAVPAVPLAVVAIGRVASIHSFRKKLLEGL